MPASCGDVVAPLIASGDLHTARFAALHYCMQPAVQPSSIGSWAHDLVAFDKKAGVECAAAWKEQLNNFFLQVQDPLGKIHAAHLRPKRSPPPLYENPVQEFEPCCSHLETSSREQCGLATPSSSRCALASGSSAALLLPMLREPKISIALRTSNDVREGNHGPILLHIEQDGFLRPFDVATVVWPAGYLLGLWVAGFASMQQELGWAEEQLDAHDEASCTGSSGSTSSLSVLDLGTGTGVSAIAAAASLGEAASVTASDKANHSLALVTANAALNGYRSVKPAQLDYERDEDVAAFALSNGPFDLVMGAALMEFASTPRLWQVLRALTSKGSSEAASSLSEHRQHGKTRRHRASIVALAHTVGGIDKPPPGCGFDEVKRISGLEYGLHTRWSREESDFEVVVLRRV